MYKTFCNFCENEITDKNCDQNVVNFSVKNRSGDEINFGIGHHGAKADDVHCCKYCMIDAFSKLDDRPKCMEAK